MAGKRKGIEQPQAAIVQDDEGAVVEPTDAVVDAEAQDDGLVEVIASSLSAPGHRRGGHFWPAGSLAKARVTPKQAEQIRRDPRITVFDPNAEIPSTSQVQSKFEDHIRTEMNRIADEQRRAQAVDNMRRRTEPVAGPRDYPDRPRR